MVRPLTIKLDADLPLRARAASGAEMSKIFGGCQQENDQCHPVEMPCCYETMNDTGSGHYVLTCIGFTSGSYHVCAFV